MEKIKLVHDFWTTQTFFAEVPEGETFIAVDKEEGELHTFFKSDDVEIGTNYNLDEKMKMIETVRENPDRYMVIEEASKTLRGRGSIMEKYNLEPVLGIDWDGIKEKEKEKRA